MGTFVVFCCLCNLVLFLHNLFITLKGFLQKLADAGGANVYRNILWFCVYR